MNTIVRAGPLVLSIALSIGAWGYVWRAWKGLIAWSHMRRFTLITASIMFICGAVSLLVIFPREVSAFRSNTTAFTDEQGKYLIFYTIFAVIYGEWGYLLVRKTREKYGSIRSAAVRLGRWIITAPYRVVVRMVRDIKFAVYLLTHPGELAWHMRYRWKTIWFPLIDASSRPRPIWGLVILYVWAIFLLWPFRSMVIAMIVGPIFFGLVLYGLWKLLSRFELVNGEGNS